MATSRSAGEYSRRFNAKMRRLTRAARVETARTFEQEANRITARMRAQVRRKSGAAASTIKWRWHRTLDLAVRITAGGRRTQKDPRRFSMGERVKHRLAGRTVKKFDYVMALEHGTKRHRVGGLFAGAWHPGSRPFPFFYKNARAGKSRARRVLKERWRNSMRTAARS